MNEESLFVRRIIDWRGHSKVFIVEAFLFPILIVLLGLGGGAGYFDFHACAVGLMPNPVLRQLMDITGCMHGSDLFMAMPVFAILFFSNLCALPQLKGTMTKEQRVGIMLLIDIFCPVRVFYLILFALNSLTLTPNVYHENTDVFTKNIIKTKYTTNFYMYCWLDNGMMRIGISEDVYNQLNEGDSLVVDYRKGIIGYANVDSYCIKKKDNAEQKEMKSKARYSYSYDADRKKSPRKEKQLTQKEIDEIYARVQKEYEYSEHIEKIGIKLLGEEEVTPEKKKDKDAIEREAAEYSAYMKKMMSDMYGVMPTLNALFNGKTNFTFYTNDTGKIVKIECNKQFHRRADNALKARLEEWGKVRPAVCLGHKESAQYNWYVNYRDGKVAGMNVKVYVKGYLYADIVI